LIHDRTPLLDVGVFEQEQRLGSRIATKESLQDFDSGLLTEAPGRAPFLQAPLLVNADIGGDDLHQIQMGVDPFDYLLGSRRAMNARSLNIDRIWNPYRQPRSQQSIECSRKH